MQYGQGVPAAGAESAQPAHRNERPRHARPHQPQQQEGVRRPVLPGRHPADGSGSERGESTNQ